MNLYGPVRADKSVGTGKATVTLSMDWKANPVAPTTHTVLVSGPKSVPTLAVSSRLIRSLPHPDRTATITDVRFTPKGTLFAVGYPSGVVQLWDTATGMELRRIESPRGYRGSADYALAPADFGTLFVPIEGDKASRDETDPKRRWRRDYDGKILVWDLATGEPKPSLKAQPGCGVVSAKLSPDGTRLISMERPSGLIADTTLPDVMRMTDTATGRSWKLVEGYGIAAFSPDSKLVYVSVTDSNEKEGRLLVFDREGKEQPSLAHQKKRTYFTPTLSPDGKRVVANVSTGRINEPGSLRVFDQATGKPVAEFASGGDFPFRKPLFSPDSRLLAAGDYKGRMKVFDVAKRSIFLDHTFEGMDFGWSLAFSKDGRHLAVPVRVKSDPNDTNDDDPRDLPQPRIYLFDLTKPKSAPEVIVCPHGRAGSVAFSADGKMLAFGSAGAVHLFDVSGPAK